MTIEFKPWGKTPRLFREIVITEKIDGTNGAVIVQPYHEDDLYSDQTPPDVVFVDAASGDPGHGFLVGAQSRNRLVTPENDNAGFARWVYDNAKGLANTLGPGYHYGEWWGQGIQRGYGLDHKRFSLFNTSRWNSENLAYVNTGVKGLDVVPELYRGVFNQDEIDSVLEALATHGSFAAPDYEGNAEGIIVYHSQSKQVYKVLLENDQISKTEAGA